MLIVDAHLDLAWNALQWNRDLSQSVYTLRTQESGVQGAGRGQGTVALPELRQGRVALCFATLLARSTGRPKPGLDYLSIAQAHGAARGQLAYYRALEAQGHVRLVTRLDELNAHVAEWEQWETLAELETHAAGAPPRLGLVVSMESADPILGPDELADWWHAGVRLIGPAHYGPGRYAGGTGTELGLTPGGVELLSRMERLHVILDLTHLADQAYWQALDTFSGPVIASHNNCRALVPHQRQFDEAQLRALIARDGVVGVVFDNWMLRPGWRRGAPDNAPVSLAHVVDHIDHICQLAGNCRHVAIGSDLDGGFGREQSPGDLDTIADLQKLSGLLTERGYARADVVSIMNGNWLNLLRSAWGRL
jgi:membrane dipeptidase